MDIAIHLPPVANVCCAAVQIVSILSIKAASSKMSRDSASERPADSLEAIAFGGILIVILYLMIETGSFGNALPIISLYVFAGYRLLPALQQIYSSMTQLTFVGPSLDKLHEDIKHIKPSKIIKDEGVFSLSKSIALKNIYYNYPNAARIALKNINQVLL